MEQFKRLLRKLFFPKPWMTLLSIPVAAVLLIYTFAGGHKEDWIAIPAYVFICVQLVTGLCQSWIVVPDTRKKMLS